MAHLQKLVKALSEALRVSSHVQPSGLALHPSLQGFQLLNGLVAHLSCKTILLLHNKTGSHLNLKVYGTSTKGCAIRMHDREAPQDSLMN